MANPSQIDKALRKEQVVLAALAIQRSGKGDRRALLAALAAQNRISLSTLYRWIKAYRHAGLSGLFHGRVRRSGRSRTVKSTDPAAIEHLRQLLAASAAPSKAAYFHLLQEEAARNGWRLGSRASFYRLLDTLLAEMQPPSQKPASPAPDPGEILHQLSSLSPDDLKKVSSYIKHLAKNTQ